MNSWKQNMTAELDEQCIRYRSWYIHLSQSYYSLSCVQFWYRCSWL